MESFLVSIEYLLNRPEWQYFIGAGFLLMLLELVISDFFLLWVGAACLLTGGVCALHPLNVLGVTSVFSVFSFLCLASGYVFYERRSVKSVTKGLNDKVAQLIGCEAELMVDEMNPSHYCLFINDTRWSVRFAADSQPLADGVPVVEAYSPDQSVAGAWVRVVAVDGNSVLVEGRVSPSPVKVDITTSVKVAITPIS